MNMLSKIGFRVKEIRNKRNITQEALAEQTNLSLTCISRLENEHAMVSLEKLWTIAQALDTDFSQLLCDYMAIEPVNNTNDQALVKQFHLLSSENQNNIRALIEIMLANQKDPPR